MPRFNRPLLRALSVFVLSSGMAAVAAPAGAQQSGEVILDARCSSCHDRLADGRISRIGEIRKTPEGWDMNIARMIIMHGVEITSEERGALVKHLSDTQGLAPSETRDWRYILERRSGVFEDIPDEDLGVMCARCHSYARTALQRRDEAEWVKHAHFHQGQWPTTEYQALGRDRNWWELASTQVPKRLGELYPLQSEAWDNWKARAAPDLSGSWRVIGNRPGKGAFQGVAVLAGKGNDAYGVKMFLFYADGSKANGEGEAILYTGYEWRASVTLDGEDTLQVMAVSAGGGEMSGRWFLEDPDSIGGDIVLARAGKGAAARIMAVFPPHIRIGETATLTLHGVGLGGDIDLGSDVSVDRIVSRSSDIIVVEATASGSPGARTVVAGAAQGPDALMVYDKVDSIRVEPAYTIARVGGGAIAPVPAQFEAVAFMDGPDGVPGNDDDVRIGVMPAQWTVGNHGDFAAALDDAKFAGAITQTGLFEPAVAGPNPARPFSTNNAGDLAITASVDVGGQSLQGTAQLIVTVQRWNDPPIR
ncbi:MAG: quinohemoprotein amine dehydrogenase subunit alpha [Rhodospirillales bacterium]|nr:MAG: quinohemoprotein amine dehydrogenase subunit alpha [Rhodospirillales bacterium]